MIHVPSRGAGVKVGRRPTSEIAKDHEARVQRFLRDFGFEGVQGGSSFSVGGIQVDAIGVSQDTVFVIECKTGPQKGIRVRNAIFELRGQIDQIRRGLKLLSPYEKYDDVRFVIATNAPAHPKDRELAEGEPPIQLWDGPFLDYYDELNSMLVDVARFSLYGELGLHPSQRERVKTPAFQFGAGRYRAYSFFLPADVVAKYAYVARREIGREAYYQRWLDKRKLRKIREYVDAGGSVANSILLALPSKDSTRFQAKHVPHLTRNLPKAVGFGELSLPNEFRSCWLVDGQHRLFGVATSSTPSAVLPILAVEGLQIEDQAELFLDINKNQKPVPSDLVWDLEGELRPLTPDGVISRVAKELNARGPLKGRIGIPLEGRSRRGKLRLTGVCRAVRKYNLTAPSFGKSKIVNPLYDEEPDGRVRAVGKELNRVMKTFEKVSAPEFVSKFWHDNSGFAVAAALCSKTAEHYRRRPTEVELERILRAAADHIEQEYAGREGLSSLRTLCTSEAGRSEVVTGVVLSVRNMDGLKEFGEGISGPSLLDEITSLERNLWGWLSKRMSEEVVAWDKRFLEKEVRDRALQRKKKNGTETDPLHAFLSWGELKETLARKDVWKLVQPEFKKVGFRDANAVSVAMTFLNDKRGDVAHGRRKLDRGDESILSGYISKLENILSNAEDEDDEDAGG